MGVTTFGLVPLTAGQPVRVAHLGRFWSCHCASGAVDQVLPLLACETRCPQRRCLRLGSLSSAHP